jgi:hypothetical protein
MDDGSLVHFIASHPKADRTKLVSAGAVELEFALTNYLNLAPRRCRRPGLSPP